MRPLYEIDKDLEEAMSFEIDEETGEIISDLSKLDVLMMEREQKIEGVICAYKNANAEKEMLKCEADNLYKRAKQAERKAESMKNWIAYALNGEKFSSPKAAVSYRKSKAVRIDNEEMFLNWAELSGHDELLKFEKPKISKTAVKDFLLSGGDCPAELEERESIIIK